MHTITFPFLPGDTVRIKNKFAATYKVRLIIIDEQQEVFYRGWTDDAPVDEYGNVVKGFMWEWQAKDLELMQEAT